MSGDKNAVRRFGIFLAIVTVALVASYLSTLSNQSGDQAVLSGGSYQRVNSSTASMTAHPSSSESQRYRETIDGDSSQAFLKMARCSRLNPTLMKTQFNIKPIELKAPPFLEKFKNPCWKAVDVANKSKGKIRCLPYAYFLGMSKCGTTDLMHTIETHPNITFGRRSDYFWWNLKRVGLSQLRGKTLTNHGRESLTKYASYFDEASAQIQKKKTDGMHYMVTVDTTSSTMWNTDGWPAFPGNRNLSQPRITTAHYLKAVVPDAKLIAILRNPTDRLYSDYLFLRHAYDNNIITNPEHFHDMSSKAVRIMNACMASRGARECVYDPCLHINMPVRLRIGLYSIYLEDWLKVFKREQFRLIRTEDYAKSRVSAVEDLSTFLQIGPLPEEVKEEMNSRDVVRARRPTKVKEGDMLPKTRKLLEDFHRPFNKKLADLFEDDRFLWQ